MPEPKVLILDEPTRGVDVVAKAEVHASIDRVAQKGIAILLISSELPEILGMSDRVLVMRDGAVVGEFSRTEATEERLVALAAGASHDE
jgi:ABC-type sugar transport system ATPase subunit